MYALTSAEATELGAVPDVPMDALVAAGLSAIYVDVAVVGLIPAVGVAVRGYHLAAISLNHT